MAAAFSFAILASAILLLFNPASADAPRRALITNSSTMSQFLDPHNVVRARYGLPRLRWNTTVANYARWYASLRSVDCLLVHSDTNYGENIFWGQGHQWTIAQVVDAWAVEGANYDYQTNTCKPGADCTHYTQMVWRTTQLIGCARVTCQNGDTFMTCNYDPHGNVINAWPY